MELPVRPLPSFYPLDTDTVARIMWDHIMAEATRQAANATPPAAQAQDRGQAHG